LIVGITGKKKLGLSIAGLVICLIPVVTSLAVLIGGVSILNGLF
jgi:hypothetical protein